MNDDYTASIEVTVVFHSPHQEGLFLLALTGNDDDILLAMEKAVNERLGIDRYSGPVEPVYVLIEDD